MTEVQRPAAGPLVVGVFEAIDPQSVDREFLGSVKVEADWLAANDGELSLELKLDQDFEITASVRNSAGASIELELVPPG